MLFGSNVHWYAVCVGLALASLAGWLYYQLRVSAVRCEQEMYYLAAFPLMLLAGVVFAIGADALFTGDWRTWFGYGELRIGLTFVGFLIGAVVFLAGYGRTTGLGAVFLLNSFLPSFALAQGIGRVGCFLGGCCYGVPCEWGVSYHPGSLPYSVVGGTRLFPVQLFEAGALMILFFVCAFVAFRRRAAVYLVGVSIIRFILDYLRYDDRGTLFGIGGLSPQQILSLGLLLGVSIKVSASHDQEAGDKPCRAHRRRRTALSASNIRRWNLEK